MRKRVAMIGALSGLLIAVAFAQNNALNMQPTVGSLELTATHIIEMATQTRMALPYTPIPPTAQVQTASAIIATRTAIALTREPSLAVSPIPNNIQLTATRIVSDVELTITARIQPVQPGTLDSNSLTATAIIVRATESAVQLTSNPQIALTRTELALTRTLEACQPTITNHFQSELTSQVQRALAQAGIQDAFVGIVTLELREPLHCDTPTYPLSTFFSVELEVSDLFDEDALAELTTDILSVLTLFPPTEKYGLEPTRFLIIFRQGLERRTIDTGFSNALTAYEEDLRGVALLEALGGILPTWWGTR